MKQFLNRFFLGPPGAESDKRVVRQLIFCFVWIAIALVEMYLTGLSRQTRILSWIWGLWLILWVTIASFGVRVYLDRRRLRRARR